MFLWSNIQLQINDMKGDSHGDEKIKKSWVFAWEGDL